MLYSEMCNIHNGLSAQSSISNVNLLKLEDGELWIVEFD